MSEIKARLEKIRNGFSKMNVDSILISKRENYIYLSGFTGSSAYLLITSSQAFLITDFRYTEQASKQALEYEVIEYSGNIKKTIAEKARKLGIKKLGFEDDYTTVSSYNEFREVLQEIELMPSGSFVDRLRLVKDKNELEVIGKAVEIADAAFNNVLKYIRPGVSEIELASEIEYYMKKCGATGPSFETIVASGKRSALPHGVASEKLVQNGDSITFDFGCIYKNYCSDMTRTVFLGKPDAELIKIYEIVLKAQLEASNSARAGLLGKEIDKVARDIIVEAGFESNFGHGLGHGVGLEVHEEPRLSIRGDIVMENGMVVTVEPGIYVNELGGVRIEDIIVINGNHPQVLTSSTKELIII